MLLHDRERDVARALDGNAVGDCARRGCSANRAAGERINERRAGLGLDADDRRLGPQRLDGDGNTRNQPATTARYDDQIRIGQLGDDLEPHRPLARDDVLVVERRDKDRALALGDRARSGHRLIAGNALELDPRAVATRGLDLRKRRVDRHADGARHPKRLRSER